MQGPNTRPIVLSMINWSYCRRRRRKAKEKYQGVFEIQKSAEKTSSGEIGLDIRTHASPKVGQDQVSGGVSVLCWHAAPVAYINYLNLYLYKLFKFIYLNYFRSRRDEIRVSLTLLSL